MALSEKTINPSAASGQALLAVDVGCGTQDILLYDSRQEIENCVKLVLPSQTQIVARRIRQATRQGRTVFLAGNLMGGGPCVGAMQEHLEAGLDLYATELAAKTVRDRPEEVAEMGIRLATSPPPGALTILLGDLDLKALRKALSLFLVDVPGRYAVAVQDHGECLMGSNREFRFQYWKRFLQDGGDIDGLIYAKAPNPWTRMQAVQRDLPGALVMDTGAAAVHGALCDARVSEKAQERGAVILNVGNQHTLGVLLHRGRILGLFEHHTSLLTSSKLQGYVERLRMGHLTPGEVFQDGGHGNLYHPDSGNLFPWEFVAVTGPRRQLAIGLDCYFAVPQGDMMLAGCFGLVRAALRFGSGSGVPYPTF